MESHGLEDGRAILREQSDGAETLLGGPDGPPAAWASPPFGFRDLRTVGWGHPHAGGCPRGGGGAAVEPPRASHQNISGKCQNPILRFDIVKGWIHLSNSHPRIIDNPAEMSNREDLSESSFA